MDAFVIVDPVQYQRRRDERDDVSMPLRSLQRLVLLGRPPNSLRIEAHMLDADDLVVLVEGDRVPDRDVVGG